MNNKYSSNLKDFFYMNSRIIINGNDYMTLENCKKVMEFNDLYIKIKTSDTIIQVWGNNLCIDDFGINRFIIKGKINSIEFTSEKRR